MAQYDWTKEEIEYFLHVIKNKYITILDSKER